MAFSLIGAFKESCFKRPELNLLCLGLDGAGKTAAFERTKQSFARRNTTAVPFDKIAPTLGLNIAKLDILGCRVTVWDLGGDSKMRGIWKRYYPEAHGVVFVIDAADPARFQEAKGAFSSACAHAELLDVPILIFANKSDLEFVVKPSALEELLSLRSRAQPLHLQCASALNNEGVKDGINWLVRQAKQRLASPDHGALRIDITRARRRHTEDPKDTAKSHCNAHVNN